MFPDSKASAGCASAAARADRRPWVTSARERDFGPPEVPEEEAGVDPAVRGHLVVPAREGVEHLLSADALGAVILAHVPVQFCDARDRSSSKHVLVRLLEHLMATAAGTAPGGLSHQAWKLVTQGNQSAGG